MKVSTTKENILNAVLAAERVVGKKESLPVLSCILIESTKELIIRATNLEAAIELVVPADCGEKGMVAVPATVLSQTLRSMGGGSVTLSTEEGNLLLQSRGTKTLIKAIPHTEFPVLTGADTAKGISVSRERFIHGLQATLYAASPSMIRPELGSVFISFKDGKLVTVATDSFRLAEKTISDTHSKADMELLVPLRHALELTHVLERMGDENIRIASDDSQLAVSAGGMRYVSRIIDASFPNYRDIVPKSATTEATVLKSDLAEVLRKARVFSGNEQHIGFHIYPKKKIFTATARSNDVGEMSDSIDAALEGEDLDINFHVGYLSECLPSIESDSVVLGFAGAGKPLVVRGVSDHTYMYLVMPLNR